MVSFCSTDYGFYLASSGSKGLRQLHAPQWWPRPQIPTRTSGFNTAWGSIPQIPTWPPGAAQTIEVSRRFNLENDPFFMASIPLLLRAREIMWLSIVFGG